ncbi:MAG: DUF4230 domain-containing protein [Acidimicrobiales bacterium]
MKTTLKAVITAATVILISGLAVTMFGLPGLPNPFGEETVVRDHAAVLQSIEDMSEYRAASGEYQVVIDIEDDTRFVPSFLKGERTTFLAQGTVDALVDLGGIDEESVIVGEDGSVTVILPPATLADPEVDHEASAVLDRDRGVLDRVGGVFSDAPTSEKELYLEAEDRLAEAADGSELLETAQDNTTTMIEDLFVAAGFDDVRVVYRGGVDDLS